MKELYMSQEKSYFIQVLKDYLHGDKSKPNEKVEWSKMVSYAKAHEVEGIVFYQCKEFLPLDVADLLKRKFSTTIFYYKNRESAANDIGNAFERKGIPYVMVKGMDVAACYPIPSLRTMGDLDIVVHAEDKERADQVLTALGYSCRKKAPDYDWSYDHNKMHVELHHQLFYIEPGRNKNSKVQEEFFDECWKYVNNGKLDWSFHFLFVLAHLRKHLVNSGAGFRMFMDVAAIINNDPGLNWLWIEQKLELLKMGKFAKICFALCESWFGVKSPISYEVLNEDYIEEATEKIFANGIFGFHDKSNRNNVAINSIIKNGKARKLSRVQMVLRHMFPKYIHMCYIPYYHFIEGRPWLLPVAWIYRYIRLLTGKTDNLSRFINNVKLSDEEVDVREAEMRRWGLVE